jgi:hypothetical protein
MTSRADWDAQFKALSHEADEEARSRDITDACIAGRLSLMVEAQKALKEGANLEQFIVVYMNIVARETLEGKVDAGTFTIPQTVADFDVDES